MEERGSTQPGPTFSSIYEMPLLQHQSDLVLTRPCSHVGWEVEFVRGWWANAQYVRVKSARLRRQWLGRSLAGQYGHALISSRVRLYHADRQASSADHFVTDGVTSARCGRPI